METEQIKYIYIALAVIFAAISWLAVMRSWPRVGYITKPAVILALLAFVITSGGIQGLILWLVLGLAFSLAGDILLMLPQNLFVAGLVAFLLAQIAYIVAFNPIPPPKTPHLMVAGLIVLLVALPASQIYRRLAAALQSTGKSSLKIPILVYILAISLMAISALFTLLRGSWLPMHALAVAAGGLFFMLSDTLLSWNSFIAPLPKGQKWIVVTYHLAQILIALGATLHFISGPVL